MICWGYGGNGRLGYGNTNSIGDRTTPGSVGPVNLGGRSAVAISAGSAHTCVILEDGTVHCWGFGFSGQLGYGNQNNVGDTQASTPASAGSVNLGAGRTAVAISPGNVAISPGNAHTCARLDDGSVHCWGYGANGRLGYCSESNVGDAPTNTPAIIGPVNVVPGDGGDVCASPVPFPSNASPPSTPGQAVTDPDAARARGFHACLATVSARATHARVLTHRGSQRQRARARRRLARQLAGGRRRSPTSGDAPWTGHRPESDRTREDQDRARLQGARNRWQQATPGEQLRHQAIARADHQRV